MDLQTYLLYELLLSRRREVAQENAERPRRAQGARLALVPRVLSLLGDTLVFSGRKLKERYEPMVRPQPRTSN